MKFLISMLHQDASAVVKYDHDLLLRVRGWSLLSAIGQGVCSPVVCLNKISRHWISLKEHFVAIVVSLLDWFVSFPCTI